MIINFLPKDYVKDPNHIKAPMQQLTMMRRNSSHKFKMQMIRLCAFMTILSNSLYLNDNQSPKGNMWSAIPVALLHMLVIVSDG